MKLDHQPHLVPPAGEKHDILAQFLHDRELIERLKITPQEHDSLAKCALLGTLTCKQDLLFILRQIREATSPGGPPTVFASGPAAALDDSIVRPVLDLGHIRAHLVAPPQTSPKPAAPAAMPRRRSRAQNHVILWSIVLLAGLMWNAAIAIYHWRESLMSGTAVLQAPASVSWIARVDDFRFLIFLEIAFVVSVAVVMYVVSLRKRPRRLKVRPS